MTKLQDLINMPSTQYEKNYMLAALKAVTQIKNFLKIDHCIEVSRQTIVKAIRDVGKMYFITQPHNIVYVQQELDHKDLKERSKVVQDNFKKARVEISSLAADQIVRIIHGSFNEELVKNAIKQGLQN